MPHIVITAVRAPAPGDNTGKEILNMRRKVTIIGTGNVGSTIAYTMAVCGIANEVLMIDINTEKAMGEAMDIDQGTPFCPPITVRAGGYEDAVGSDIVIITSGIARKPGQTRLDLAQTNVNILKSIAPQITKYAPDAIYLIVANPVDIMTYAFCKVSGIPESHVIGSGTILDTARLRSYIAEHFSISEQNVHSYVFGEHGDTMFIPWSIARISTIGLDSYNKTCLGSREGCKTFNYNDADHHIRTSGAQIIESKGATFYAVAVSTCHICKCIFSRIDTVLTVSSMMHGEYGIDDVCLSVLNVVSSEGLKGKLEAELNESEREQLRKSAAQLKEVIKNLDI